MEATTYQEGVAATFRKEHRPLDERELGIVHAMMGLMGELGEVAEHVKKRIFMDRQEFMNQPEMKKELGDVEYYITQMETLMGLLKSEVMEGNNRKLAARYPKGFVPGGGIRVGEAA